MSATRHHSVQCPFGITIDLQEQLPFPFSGIKADADKQNRELIISTIVRNLGIYLDGIYEPRGDYSVSGLEDYSCVERKSLDDVQATVLGWGDRRTRFVRELEVLSKVPVGAVVVECSMGRAIDTMQSRGAKSIETNQKIFFRQVLAWQQDYRVPWYWCDTRRLAEITTFRILERAFHKHRKERKQKNERGLFDDDKN